MSECNRVKHTCTTKYSKTCLKRPLLKRSKNGFQYQASLNEGQKYCRMLQGEHSAALSTFIMLPFSIKTFLLSILSGRFRPGRVAQSVTCLVTDAKLTADLGVASSIPARSHTFVEIDHEIIFYGHSPPFR